MEECWQISNVLGCIALLHLSGALQVICGRICVVEVSGVEETELEIVQNHMMSVER